MMMAVVAALREEVKDFLAWGGFKLAEQESGTRFYRSPEARNVVVVESGIGRTRAEKATRLAAETFRPDFIASVGFAGGVRSGLETSDLLLCGRVWAVEGPLNSWSPETALSQTLVRDGLYDRVTVALKRIAGKDPQGDCLSVPRVVSSNLEKERIGQRFPVSVIDMEGFWVCQTAARYNVPHVVVKCVLDPLEQSLPSFLDGTSTSIGDSVRRLALRYALARPAEIPRLIRLTAQVKAARSSLAAFLKALASGELPHSNI